MPEDPLFKKLRFQPNQKILIFNSPPGYLAPLGDFPPESQVETEIEGGFDLIHGFFKTCPGVG